MTDNSFYTGLLSHFFGILGFLFLLCLGLEALLKHVRPVIAAARRVYLDIKSWKGVDRARPALAQTTSTGTVTGQVTDQHGAVVPGADVTLIDLATKATQETATNETGRYTFVNVPPGMYDVTVSKTGFRLVRIAAQKLTVGLLRTTDVTMEIASVSETVPVSASVGAELQTANSTVGQTISDKNLAVSKSSKVANIARRNS